MQARNKDERFKQDGCDTAYNCNWRHKELQLEVYFRETPVKKAVTLQESRSHCAFSSEQMIHDTDKVQKSIEIQSRNIQC